MSNMAPTAIRIRLLLVTVIVMFALGIEANNGEINHKVVRKQDPKSITIDSSVDSDAIDELVKLKVTVVGSIEITSNSAITDDQINALFLGITTVQDSITISNVAVTSIMFPALKTVGTKVTLDNNAKLQKLQFPKLESVDMLSINKCGAMATLSAPSLVTINTNLNIQFCPTLSTDKFIAGFESLETIKGSLYLRQLSIARGLTESDLVLPELQKLGSVNVRELYQLRTISFPRLTTITATFTLYSVGRLQHLDLPSLETVGGNILFTNVNVLSSLCSVGLEESGFKGSTWTIQSSENLVSMPAWVATLTSTSTSSECTNHPAIVIRNQADFDKFAGNTTLVNSVDVGSVIISWGDITDANLATLLQKKTMIGELVIEDATKVTTLSPALDALQTVNARLVLENMGAVSEVSLGKLKTVGAGVSVLKLGKLTLWEASALVSVGGTLTVEDCNSLTSISVPELVTISGSVSIQRCFYLPASMFLTGFESLTTVRGNFYLRTISVKGADALSDLILPEVETLGGFTLSECYSVRSIVMPKLTTITGRVFLYASGKLAHMEWPSLTSVGGNIDIVALAILSSLCSLGLEATGFTGTRVSITRSPNLIHMPPWIATNASLSTAVDCPVHKAVVIRTEGDYDRFASNTTLINSADIGTVLISWAGITDTQLATLLSKKTNIGELVLEDLTQLTTLSPALDAVETVTSRLLFENIAGVSEIFFKKLKSVGTGVAVLGFKSLTTFESPSLVSVGGAFTVENNNKLTSISAPDLVTINATLSIQRCSLLPAAMFVTGFASLKTIKGNFYMRGISVSGPDAISDLYLPEIETLGGLTINECYSMRSASFPKLTRISDRIFFYASGKFSVFNAPSLTSVGGNIDIVALAILSSLCSLGLEATGFTGTRVSITRSPNLVHMPPWIATNASLSTTAECPHHATIVIRSKADYDKYESNTTLVNSVDIGSVIISWADITDAQLSKLLEKKQVIGELVIEDASALTSFSPALDALVNVTTRLYLANIAGVTDVSLKNLINVGTGITVIRLSKLKTFEMPKLINISGSMQLEHCNALTSLSASTLVNIETTFYLRWCYALPANVFKSGFASLKTIGETLEIRAMSNAGADAITDLEFPKLVSVGGSLLIRESAMAGLLFPKLTTIGRRFSLYVLNNLVAFDFPSLTLVGTTSDNIDFTVLPKLTSLCNFTLTKDEFKGNQLVLNPQRKSTLLKQMPEWMSAAGNIADTNECPSRPPTSSPSVPPTGFPTLPPTTAPTHSPATNQPTPQPTGIPSASPSVSPSVSPSALPTSTPTALPSSPPSPSPTRAPSRAPTPMPTSLPTLNPTSLPSSAPSSSSTTTTTTSSVSTIVTTMGVSINNQVGSNTATSTMTTIIIVVMVVIVLLAVVVGLAMYIWKRKQSGGKRDEGLASFENPMYDTHENNNDDTYQHNNNVGQDDAATGYMDVPAGTVTDFNGGALGDESMYEESQPVDGYMDVAPKAASGYMDVVHTGGTGYMDVAPNEQYEDDSEEDV